MREHRLLPPPLKSSREEMGGALSSGTPPISRIHGEMGVPSVAALRDGVRMESEKTGVPSVAALHNGVRKERK